ncbi:MAG: AAA family ATPase [Actinomycetota bacterium]|nr:AAA family ATPase [Actinomycetota bacterium]
MTGAAVDRLAVFDAPSPNGVAPSSGAPAFKTGASFILDDPVDLDPVWGSGEDVLWAAGEPLLLVGPTGVGKTTLTVQLVAGRLGIIDEVLGWPVKPADKPVLYLALDRPNQIRRAMRRVFDERHREVLHERLRVREGHLDFDLGRVPEHLLELASACGAGTVVRDSLKDAAVKLSDDEAGGHVNRALQLCVRDGIDVLALHHQRKGQSGAKPKSLEDVYGSTWITAGAGSVILLWGKPGDLIVELRHLKQPAAEVGPLKVEHDHAAGKSTVSGGCVDALAVLRSTTNGITSVDLARWMFECDTPDDNQRKKALRQLNRLVEDGKALKADGARNAAGGAVAARYVAITDRRAGP